MIGFNGPSTLMAILEDVAKKPSCRLEPEYILNNTDSKVDDTESKEITLKRIGTYRSFTKQLLNPYSTEWKKEEIKEYEAVLNDPTAKKCSKRYARRMIKKLNKKIERYKNLADAQSNYMEDIIKSQLKQALKDEIESQLKQALQDEIESQFMYPRAELFNMLGVEIIHDK